jgi:hypothetical protein
MQVLKLKEAGMNLNYEDDESQKNKEAENNS